MSDAKDHSAILIVDHGSRRAQANELLENLCLAFSERHGVIVEPAHMELAEPSIETAFARLSARGIKEVTVLPFFLARGRHLSQDIPELCCKAAQTHNMSYKLAGPLGEQPAILDLFTEMLKGPLTCPGKTIALAAKQVNPLARSLRSDAYLCQIGTVQIGQVHTKHGKLTVLGHAKCQ